MDIETTLSPTEPVPPPKSPFLRRIFVGKDGIRAGWSLLIFLLIFAGIIVSIQTVIQKRHWMALPKPGTEISAGFAIANELIPFVVTCLVTWIMSKIEKRPNSVYGLGDTRKVQNFLAGLGWGVVFLSLLVFSLWKTGLLVIERRLLFGVNVLRWGAIWLVCFLLVGLFEEYLTRGYMQYTLTRGLAGIYRIFFKTSHSQSLGFWTAALLLSILFGLGHESNPGESPIGLLSAGLAGVVFCFSLWRTGSLWWAIGFHATWDWSQSFLYGVADSGMMAQHHLLATHPVGKPILSGGATGPEGSILIVVILALVSLIIVFTLSRTRDRELTV